MKPQNNHPYATRILYNLFCLAVIAGVLLFFVLRLGVKYPYP